jgi:hypothetical protein
VVSAGRSPVIFHSDERASIPDRRASIVHCSLERRYRILRRRADGAQRTRCLKRKKEIGRG